MSTFAEMKAAWLAVVTRLSGHAHVQWDDERREFAADGSIVLLRLRSFQTVGTPSASIVEAGTEAGVDVTTHKTAVLVVKVECFDQETTALELLEKLRDRLYRPYALDTLRAVDVALVRAEAGVDLPRAYDKRLCSVAAFDVRFGWASTSTQAEFDGELVDGEQTDAATTIEVVQLVGGEGDLERMGTSEVARPAP